MMDDLTVAPRAADFQRWDLSLVLTAMAWLVFTRAGAGAAPVSSAEPFSRVDVLNAGLAEAHDAPDLETPQASLENFINSCRANDFDRAARSLNLNAIAVADQADVGRTRARQLIELMDQQVWFHWSDVPDRPDGQAEDEPAFSGQSSETRGPQSSYLLYRLDVGDRDYEIRLERVKPGLGAPVWVFSRQTVRHIPTLVRAYHPGRLERSLPAVLREKRYAGVALWQWIGFAVLMAAGGLVGRLVQGATSIALRRTESPWARNVAEAIRGPGALTIGLVTFQGLARHSLGLASSIQSALDPLYATIVCISLVWFFQKLIGLMAARLSQGYASRKNDAANAAITRVLVARHLLSFLVIVGGMAYALSGFETVRRFGTAILASAGVAGIVIGIASQRILGNLFAGAILGVVQPVKVGDALIFEDEFGRIEEITVTHVVICTWDLRRLVVPITYFMDHPFQNWSTGSSQIIKPVVVFADYRLQIDLVRAELKAILESTDLWDRLVPPVLQVTDCREDTIALRALCSGRDPESSWYLHCLVRERLIAFLRDLEGGRFLPRHRVLLVDEEPSTTGGARIKKSTGQQPPRREVLDVR